MKIHIKSILISAVCISMLCSCNNSKSKTTVTSKSDLTQSQQETTVPAASDDESSVTAQVDKAQVDKAQADKAQADKAQADKAQADKAQADRAQAQQETAPAVSLEKVPADDIEAVNQTAQELYDVAQSVADRYSTAGGCIMANVFKNSDADGRDAEKMNILNFISQDFKKDGIWAFKIENFKVISVVYSPAENSGVLVRYPEAYTGDASEVTADNIDSFL